MTDFDDFTNERLLELYANFVRAWHYEAVNEFEALHQLPYIIDDVESEVLKRMNK